MRYECTISSTSDNVSAPQLQALEDGTRLWHITLRQTPDVNSAPIDLTEAGSVWFLAKVSASCPTVHIRAECDIVDPYTGLITLSLGPEELRVPGLWWGAIQIRDTQDIRVEEIPCWLLIQRSIETTYDKEPLTIPQVRSFLMDRCPADNRLLAATQFTDDEIIEFMRLPVEEWNDTPPDIQRFSTVNFPWRLPWLKATSGYLLRSLAIRQVRNNATYQTGSVTVNDSDKGPVFKQMGDELLMEWREWMMAKKREVNMRLGWGYTGTRAFR